MNDGQTKGRESDPLSGYFFKIRPHPASECSGMCVLNLDFSGPWIRVHEKVPGTSSSSHPVILSTVRCEHF